MATRRAIADIDATCSEAFEAFEKEPMPPAVTAVVQSPRVDFKHKTLLHKINIIYEYSIITITSFIVIKLIYYVIYIN